MSEIRMRNRSEGTDERPGITSRRGFLTGAAAALGTTAWAAARAQQTPGGPTTRRRYGPHAEPVRYPDPDIVVLDPRFAKIKIGNSSIRRLHTGMLWAEGPAWNGVGKYLVWSDIPNDIQLRWLEDDGHVSVMRHPAGNSNGNTLDREGRQISCEHGNRRVVRYEYDGKTTVLADHFDGKRLNAPNDAVVHPDGGIWFTDPGYGALMDYEGNKGPLEIKEAVYRIDPGTGKVAKVTDDLFKPNGLCFSPDYKTLYVADTGASHYPEAPRNIRAYDVVDGVKLARGREFASMKLAMAGGEFSGFADGIRCDVEGNLYAGAGWVGPGYDGVHVFAPDGVRIGQILLPEICANVCFGGPKRNRLFMAASQSLYAVYLDTRGAHFA
ncbi:MAG TPA: SMP-30/gluconolactonase/LRE family protein [Isosphaeraceae bacterium]|nr:SMP-30/gluconolactonase/LRE family protein [Isosphaeraceae bacterium]